MENNQTVQKRILVIIKLQIYPLDLGGRKIGIAEGEMPV
ncbi:MAG: hypothetical protein Ct9H90mP8_1470 [Pseudomonadota bacterium]|nr:MAG: hypothetical protein Ct9H90mP8_1470 [Pseudomonadota bacterium]